MIESLHKVADATNQNFQCYVNYHSRISRRNKTWCNLVPSDLLWHLGVVIFMSMIKVLEYDFHWKKNHWKNQCITDSMSYDKFVRIGQHLNFQQIRSTGIWKNRALEKWDYPKMHGFKSWEMLWIDESIISLKGRHKLKRYMPNKPKKWRFKIFYYEILWQDILISLISI